MKGGISMCGIRKWMAAILTAITASSWISSTMNEEPSIDPSQVARDGVQEIAACWNVDGKLQCSAATEWPPVEKVLMEMSAYSR